jgi:hypothetical protein
VTAGGAALNARKFLQGGLMPAAWTCRTFTCETSTSRPEQIQIQMFKRVAFGGYAVRWPVEPGPFLPLYAELSALSTGSFSGLYVFGSSGGRFCSA